jgi:hypothetical protein
MTMYELMDKAVKLTLDMNTYLSKEDDISTGEIRLMEKTADAFNRSVPKIYAGFATKLSVGTNGDSIYITIKGGKKHAKGN